MIRGCSEQEHELQAEGLPAFRSAMRQHRMLSGYRGLMGLQGVPESPSSQWRP